MLIYVVYDKERYSVNKWFADELVKRLCEKGQDARLVFVENFPTLLPDIAVVRVANYNLSKNLQNKGVKVVNNAEISKIANDKLQSYYYAGVNGVKTMPTVRGDSGSATYVKYPCVVKSRYGHGGTQVFLVNNQKEYDKAFKTIGEKDVCVQEVASEKGKDLRVYVIGNEIIAGVLRSNSSDFRSNFCLGGKASLYEIDGEIKNMVEKLLENVYATFVGIDFIFDKGKPVFNEMEDVVGCRMLYELNVCDPIELYVKEILK